MMKAFFGSRWPWVAVCAIVFAQAIAAALILAGMVDGAAQNLAAQVLIGGTTGLLLLGLGVVQYGNPVVRPGTSRIALLGLTAVGVIGVALYARRVAPFLALPVDLAGWSEPMFLLDIIKWRTGTPLYLAPADSNSTTYTFGAPLVSYLLASLIGRSDSIFVYRILHQLYVVAAAMVTGWASWRLLGVADPDRRPTRIWLAFFVVVAFLLATNESTNFFVTYLHNDPLSLLTTAVAFWLMVEHARSRRKAWLAAMALMPAAAFLVKQYLVLWAFVYIVYLWLDGSQSIRRLIAFAAACGATVAVTLGACYLTWGEPFRYWVFEILGAHVVSFTKILHLFAEAAVYLLPGALAAWMLLDPARRGRLLGIWAAWPIMVLGATYSTGITFHPTHLGPATLVGGGLFLTALALFWPSTQPARPSTDVWIRLGTGVLVPLMLFISWRVLVPRSAPVSPDLQRYVADIEREFEGLPVEKVLVDTGEWIYLRHGVVARDRLSLQQTHRRPIDDLPHRLRAQEYSRILVRQWPDHRFSYENDIQRGLGKEILRYYREVRRIPAVEGMDNWNYHGMMLSEIAVLEPLSATAAVVASASASR